MAESKPVRKKSVMDRSARVGMRQVDRNVKEPLKRIPDMIPIPDRLDRALGRVSEFFSKKDGSEEEMNDERR